MPTNYAKMSRHAEPRGTLCPECGEMYTFNRSGVCTRCLDEPQSPYGRFARRCDICEKSLPLGVHGICVTCKAEMEAEKVKIRGENVEAWRDV